MPEGVEHKPLAAAEAQALAEVNLPSMPEGVEHKNVMQVARIPADSA